jgi:hypothetical protein
MVVGHTALKKRICTYLSLCTCRGGKIFLGSVNQNEGKLYQMALKYTKWYKNYSRWL